MKKFWKRLDSHVQTRQDANNQLYDDSVELTSAMKKDARITGFYGLVLGLICAYVVYYSSVNGRGFLTIALPALFALICIPFGLYQTIMGKPFGRK